VKRVSRAKWQQQQQQQQQPLGRNYRLLCPILATSVSVSERGPRFVIITHSDSDRSAPLQLASDAEATAAGRGEGGGGGERRRISLRRSATLTVGHHTRPIGESAPPIPLPRRSRRWRRDVAEPVEERGGRAGGAGGDLSSAVERRSGVCRGAAEDSGAEHGVRDRSERIEGGDEESRRGQSRRRATEQGKRRGVFRARGLAGWRGGGNSGGTRGGQQQQQQQPASCPRPSMRSVLAWLGSLA